jgi:hypothetical protein
VAFAPVGTKGGALAESALPLVELSDFGVTAGTAAEESALVPDFAISGSTSPVSLDEFAVTSVEAGIGDEAGTGPTFAVIGLSST